MAEADRERERERENEKLLNCIATLTKLDEDFSSRVDP